MFCYFRVVVLESYTVAIDQQDSLLTPPGIANGDDL